MWVSVGGHQTPDLGILTLGIYTVTCAGDMPEGYVYGHGQCVHRVEWVMGIAQDLRAANPVAIQ